MPLTRDAYLQPSGYPPGAGVPQDWGAGFLEYVRIISRRRWIIISIVAACLALGLAQTLMETPLYTATVRLQLDRESAKVVEGGDVNPSQANADIEFLRTYYELLRSRSLAERVASAVRLGDDADFFKPRGFSIIGPVLGMLHRTPIAPIAATPGDKAALEQRAAGLILQRLEVRPIAGSRLVDISFTDPSPARAQRVANGYAEGFAASNVDKRFQANAYAKTFLEDQIAQLKVRLEDSEKALLDFAEREQIVVLSEKSSLVEANLTSASTALSTVVSERIKNEQLWKQVDSAGAINLPQLLSNGVIDGLRTKRNALVTDYQEKLQTFKPSYPDMIQIQNRIKEIDRQLVTEVKTIKQSFRAAYESSQKQEEQMRAQIAGFKTEALDLQNRMIKYDFLKREVETNRGLYNGLLQRFKQVDVASGVGANNIFVVDKALLPTSPSSPLVMRALLLSLSLGLGAGLVTAFGLERLDDRVHSPEDVERLSGLPTLGIIPRIASDTTFEAELTDVRSAISEAYRSLCTGLQLSTESGLPKTLLVTSAGPSEGKSVTGMAIGKYFAAMGQKVLIIDADLRKPSMHIKLGLDNSVGLTNYLTGACSPPEAFQATGQANLAFMASGPLPPNAADLLASNRLFSLLSVGLEVFDFIVIDGPPVLGLADAQLLSSAAAATIFVVAAGQARTGMVRGALKRLQLARSGIIGTVITKFDPRSDGYGYGYGYGGGYGYGYGYGGAGYGRETATSGEKHSELADAGARAAEAARQLPSQG